MSFCPFMSVIPERSTPELQRLQASLASEMSYRRAADILRRLLPISSNHATVRNRTMRVGERLQAAGHCPAEVTEPGSPEVKKAEVTLTIDGGFVRSKPDVDSRNFEILVGRIVRPGEKPYVFSWVRSEVASMPENLIDVLRAKTAAPMPQVSVITDGGNGVQHLHRLLPGKVRSILDWFHISMRVRYLEQIVAGLLQRTETEHYAKRLLGELVSKLRWHFWHANAEKAVDKMWRILTVCRIVVPETAGFKERLEHLDWRVREFFEYLDNNKGTLLNYGKRHREGKPISTAMAESAVNQVINARMCKRQQMRWSPRGAHLLAQVRCPVTNGDLVVRLRRWPPPPVKAEAPIHPAPPSREALRLSRPAPSQGGRSASIWQKKVHEPGVLPRRFNPAGIGSFSGAAAPIALSLAAQ
jgi:negative regulator of replication initiation